MQSLRDPSLFRQQAFIAGRWSDARTGATLTVTNPASGAVLGTIPNMGEAEAIEAVEAANAAWPDWRARTAQERGAILRRMFELMLEHADDLALIMTLEQGKPLAEAKGEIRYAASFIEWFAEEGKRVYGETIPATARDKRIFVLKEPIGVCAAITPWNFPAAMITRKLGPALAAGCPMVLRPATQTPYSALALAELASRAGVPAGVFSVITGAAVKVGGVLSQHPLVRKLSFTGSTEVGRTLMKQGADTIKKLSLELGGNAPFIVFDDADLDAAVEGALASKYRNAGQTCVCVNRFYVQDGVYDAFAAKLAAAANALKVGDGVVAGTDIGPMIDENAVGKVRDHIDDAVTKGAQVIAGGKSAAQGLTFFEPTVLRDMTSDMKIAREETFGPVAALFRFETDDEVVHLANDTEFGLASYFFSKDTSRVFKVAEALEYGMVGINTGMISTEVAPFGGVKQSGLGREGSHYGIEDYLVIKYLCLQV